MGRRTFGPVVAAVVLAGALLTIGAGTAGATSPRKAATLWVAPKATVKGESAACKTAKYHTIPAALSAAKAGDTVKVCAGTYTASTKLVTHVSIQPTITTAADVTSGVHLVGLGDPTINAKGLDNGVTFFGAEGASVTGFSVEGAIGEGIVALTGANVTISNNIVEHNDNGGPKSSWTECQAQGGVPGDCGEGIHLDSVADSKVMDNTSEYNSGGILVDDDFGPNHGNLVKGNLVEDDESDCGITVVGHSTSAVNGSGTPEPTKGGTFDNTISDNIVISNGTTGFGGGVLIAAASAGAASYDNRVSGNEIAGNGLGGVTIHQHALPSDVSGNVISGNWIGTNDIDGDPGSGDSVTTGVLIAVEGVGKAIQVTVTDNTIAWNDYGIYDNSGGSSFKGLTTHGNTFQHDTKDLKA